MEFTLKFLLLASLLCVVNCNVQRVETKNVEIRRNDKKFQVKCEDETSLAIRKMWWTFPNQTLSHLLSPNNETTSSRNNNVIVLTFPLFSELFDGEYVCHSMTTERNSSKPYKVTFKYQDDIKSSLFEDSVTIHHQHVTSLNSNQTNGLLFKVNEWHIFKCKYAAYMFKKSFDWTVKFSNRTEMVYPSVFVQDILNTTQEELPSIIIKEANLKLFDDSIVSIGCQVLSWDDRWVSDFYSIRMQDHPPATTFPSISTTNATFQSTSAETVSTTAQINNPRIITSETAKMTQTTPSLTSNNTFETSSAGTTEKSSTESLTSTTSNSSSVSSSTTLSSTSNPNTVVKDGSKSLNASTNEAQTTSYSIFYYLLWVGFALALISLTGYVIYKKFNNGGFGRRRLDEDQLVTFSSLN